MWITILSYVNYCYAAVLSCEISKIIKKTYFEENLQTPPPENGTSST